MNWNWIVVGLTGGLALGSLVSMYNRLVSSRNACSESWADISTELKRRSDLVPNLVETVKGYASHERDTLEAAMYARNVARSNLGPRGSRAKDQQELQSKLRQVFALAESYPQLAASQSFQRLHQELTDCEDRIQRARRFYNSNVRVFADHREMFPSNLIARMFGFEACEYFALENDATDIPVEVTLEGSRQA